MALIDAENCPGFNCFKSADYPEIVGWHFGFSPDRIPAYHDVVLSFGAYPALKASFDVCWQQFDARVRPGPDYWAMWEDFALTSKTGALAAKRDELLAKLPEQGEQLAGEVSERPLDNPAATDETGLDQFHQSTEDLALIYGQIAEIANEVKEEHRAKRETFTDRFAELVMRRKPDMGVDGHALDTDAMVYVHLAIGLALHLERTEGRGARFWGLIDDALRAIRMPKTISPHQAWRDDPDFVTGMLYSLWNIETLIWSYLFQKSIDGNQHARALECFARAARLSLGHEHGSSPTIDWVYGYSHERLDADVLQRTFYKDSYNDVQAHIVGLIAPAQKVVDAFENVWEEDSRRTNWGELSSQCAVIAEFYFHRFGIDQDDEDALSLDDRKHLRIDSKIFDAVDRLYERDETRTEFEAVSFWNAAKGLVSQRLSPDELVASLRLAEDKKIEDRLRLYFFHEHWDLLPEEAREALVSADREYESGHGRRRIALDHLREASRAIVVDALAEPYHDFLRGKASSGGLNNLFDLQRAVEDDSGDQDLKPLVDSLFAAAASDTLSEFLDSRGVSPDDKSFVNKDLHGYLESLNGKANAANHEHNRASKSFDDEIREVYSDFMGVDRNGILPRLMRIHAKALEAVAARR